MLRLLREVSLRHFRSGPIRALLVVFGIAIGVAIFTATRSVTRTVSSAFGQVIERIAGRADLVVTSPGPGVPTELVGDVAEVEGVAHAAATLELTTTLAGSEETVLILGVDLLGDLHFLPFQVNAGEQRVIEDPLAFVNDPTAILVSSSFAREKKLEPGSEIQLSTAHGNKTFHVRAILDDQGVARAVAGHIAVMFIDALQVSFARGTLADRIDVALEEGADKQAVQQRIADAIGPQWTVEAPAHFGTRLLSLNARVQAALSLSGLAALFVGMTLIYNAVGVAVAQRRREIGVLRALGTTRARVIALFVTEALLLAVPGVLLGLSGCRPLAEYVLQETAQALAQGTTAVVPPKAELPPELLALGSLVGLLSAAIAAFGPARRGASLDPVEALRPSAKSQSEATLPYRKMFVAGVVLLPISWWISMQPVLVAGALATLLHMITTILTVPMVVVLLRRTLAPVAQAAFGISARLGLDYVQRSLGRSTVNVLALTMAVSMAVSVEGWVQSFENSVRSWLDQITFGDLSVTTGSALFDQRRAPIDESVADKVRTLPGAKTVSWRFVEQRAKGMTFQLGALDTKTFLEESARRNKSWQLVDGEPLAPGDLLDGRSVVLAENAATRLGVKAGDRLEIPSVAGVDRYRVRAVVVDYTSPNGTIFLDRTRYVERWQDRAVDVIHVYADPGTDLGRLAAAIRKSAGDASLTVTRSAELNDQLFGMIARGLAFSGSIELLVLIIALLGVMGTMAAVVIDRIREVTALRAIGATQLQIVAALVVEATFMGLCAVVGGALAGSILCVFILESMRFDLGWHLDFAFPLTGTVRTAALILLTSAIAGLLPAIRAARFDLKEGLAYE